MGAVVNHVGQCVADLPASIAFYEALGFVVERELRLPDAVVGPFLGVEPPVGFTAVYLALGDFRLELLHFADADNPPARTRVFNEPGLTHLSISVDDLAAVTERLAALGATVVQSSPMATLCRDPEGQLLELLPMSYREPSAS